MDIDSINNSSAIAILNDVAALPDGQNLKLEFATKEDRRKFQWRLNSTRTSTIQRLERNWQREMADGLLVPLPETGWENIETQGVEQDGQLFLLVGHSLPCPVLSIKIVAVGK